MGSWDAAEATVLSGFVTGHVLGLKLFDHTPWLRLWSHLVPKPHLPWRSRGQLFADASAEVFAYPFLLEEARPPVRQCRLSWAPANICAALLVLTPSLPLPRPVIALPLFHLHHTCASPVTVTFLVFQPI